MGVVRPLRAGVATLATAGLAIGGSQFFAPPAQATNSSVKARVSARTAVNIRAQAGIHGKICLLYTSPSPRDQRGYRMPSSA